MRAMLMCALTIKSVSLAECVEAAHACLTSRFAALLLTHDAAWTG